MHIEFTHKGVIYFRNHLNSMHFPHFFFWTNDKFESVDIKMDILLEQNYQNELKRIERIKKLKRIL